MKQYLDLTTWILLFAMAPLTILVLLSQNTIPGDLFYPVKRGMENVILTAASVNPGTKVAFRTDLTERRFTEAQKLLSIRADTTAFTDFVSEVSSTQGDIANFSNQQEKIEASEKLIAEITEYQNQLFQAQTQVQIAQQTVPQDIAFQITPTLTPIAFLPTQTSTPVQSPGQFQAQPTQYPVITAAPVQSPQPAVTNKPVGNSPAAIQNTPQATAKPTPLPSLTPTVTTEIANNPIKAEKVKQEIAKTNENLERVKEKLKEQREDAQFKEKIREELQKQKEEQQKSTEESKKRGENGSNNN